MKSIAFDGDFIAQHLRPTSSSISSPYQALGFFFEMMPSVTRIFIVSSHVHSVRDGYPFRILGGRYGDMITLNQAPTSNPHVYCPPEFEDLVETGQAFCRALKKRQWQFSTLKDQEIAVFALSLTRTGKFSL